MQKSKRYIKNQNYHLTSPFFLEYHISMSVRSHIKNPLVILFICTLILHLTTLYYTAINYERALDLTPLHYTIYFGIDLIGNKIKLFLYPLFGLLIITLNTIISLTTKREPLISYFLLTTSLCAELLILATQVALVTNYI